MSNLTFLDLLFAEALASGLAREARRAERPPPDNFFLLPRDPDAWMKIQAASKKENMVVCIEFTDNSSDNCKRVQGIFMDLAREFDGIPFVRAVVGLGTTYDRMRSDLGGVQYTPTILMVFYGDGGISRAKFEGMAEIMDGMSTGRIKGVIKELIQRRVRLKTAERLAESLASEVQSHLSEKEQKLRQEYESKLARQMAEKEEEIRKKEEEKKKMEEEKEQEKDRKVRLENERLRQERPQHLEELLKMDLDHASIKSIKVIMEKMQVSRHGCLSREDLKERLMASVPELRIRTSSSQSSMSSDDGINLIGAMSTNKEVESLKEELDKTKTSLRDYEGRLATLQDKHDSQIHQKEGIISSLRNQVAAQKKDIEVLQRSQSRSKGGAPAASANGGGDNAKIKNLEMQLLETRMLYTSTLQDFKIQNSIHDGSGADKDCDSVVLRVECTKASIPSKGRTYAMKVLANFFTQSTQTQARANYQNEYEVLCQLPPHKNIIHMWAFFYDRPGPVVLKHFKERGSSSRGMALFILMDEHPQNMSEHVQTLVDNKGPHMSKVICWLKDLLAGLIFLEKHTVVHRDLKLSNLLYATDGSVIISDFGKAIMLDDSFSVSYTSGFDIGGNRAHLAPEVLNCRPRNKLDYSKQPVWAAGLLAYELAGHKSPFSTGNIDQRGYGIRELPSLDSTYCSDSRFCQSLPAKFTKLVRRMLEPEPMDRPTLQECLDELNNM